jgi:hypothetical protein
MITLRGAHDPHMPFCPGLESGLTIKPSKGDRHRQAFSIYVFDSAAEAINGHRRPFYT